MTWISPWILMRIAMSAALLLTLLRAAWPAITVLRHWRVSRASEGQLLLERHVQLMTTLLRVAGVLATLSLLAFVLAADKLHAGIRGAMCAYGVFASTPAGFSALYTCLATAVAVATIGAFGALEARTATPTLARPLALLSLLLAPLAAVDLAMSLRWISSLDLSVVASCCSVELASAASAAPAAIGAGSRSYVAIGATVAAIAATVACALGARKPGRARVFFSAALAAFAAAIGAVAIVAFVAPHIFEVPGHACPFCLLRGDVYAVGYPLFFGLFYAVVWALAALLGVMMARRFEIGAAFAPFARAALLRCGFALAITLAIAAAPVVRYAFVAEGRSLFP